MTLKNSTIPAAQPSAGRVRAGHDAHHPDNTAPHGARRFTLRSLLPVPTELAFRWHEQPGALARLTPPWQNVRVIRRPDSLRDGEVAEIELRIGPLRKRWVAEHLDYQQYVQFRDRQRSGPFAYWDHVHHFTANGAAACYLEDRITYAPPLGVIGRWLGGGFLARDLQRAFAYRHRVTRGDLVTVGHDLETTPRRIAISGSSGLVGSALVSYLQGGGHHLHRLVRSRRESREPQIQWDPKGEIDGSQLEGMDVVIHLAGENIAGGRWTDEKKRQIRESRTQGTRTLCEALSALERTPKLLICASAIGYYGDRGDEWLDESSPPGTGFLPDVCQAWEAACAPAREAGIRVVNLRFGMILSARDGALAKMLTPFRLGIAGIIGTGKQYWSWIALDDVLDIVHRVMSDDSLEGPINAVTPNPVMNREFTKLLGRVLGRPTILPLPGFAARLALGEMADDLLLASARVDPRTLRDAGHSFRTPDLEDALRHLLGRTREDRCA